MIYAPAHLRAFCRDWPREVVRSAVLEALGEQGDRDLASILAHWLTESADGDEQPPFSPAQCARIWTELQGRRQ